MSEQSNFRCPSCGHEFDEIWCWAECRCLYNPERGVSEYMDPDIDLSSLEACPSCGADHSLDEFNRDNQGE